MKSFRSDYKKFTLLSIHLSTNLGNYRESQRELQKWFARQQQETLLKHQIPEDNENERDDESGRPKVEDIDRRYAPNRGKYHHSTTLDDVKIGMRNQDDNEQNEQLMVANDNQPIQSISSRSNMESGTLLGSSK